MFTSITAQFLSLRTLVIKPRLTPLPKIGARFPIDHPRSGEYAAGSLSPGMDQSSSESHEDRNPVYTNPKPDTDYLGSLVDLILRVRTTVDSPEEYGADLHRRTYSEGTQIGQRYD